MIGGICSVLGGVVVARDFAIRRARAPWRSIGRVRRVFRVGGLRILATAQPRATRAVAIEGVREAPFDHFATLAHDLPAGDLS